jgi:hypothetical protein
MRRQIAQVEKRLLGIIAPHLHRRVAHVEGFDGQALEKAELTRARVGQRLGGLGSRRRLVAAHERCEVVAARNETHGDDGAVDDQTSDELTTKQRPQLELDVDLRGTQGFLPHEWLRRLDEAHSVEPQPRSTEQPQAGRLVVEPGVEIASDLRLHLRLQAAQIHEKRQRHRRHQQEGDERHQRPKSFAIQAVPPRLPVRRQH